MPGKLEVSFNSPQCGWMSIGFSDGVNEFHTTTAHAPHEGALPALMQILTKLIDPETQEDEYILQWSRDPEEFDIRFQRNGQKLLIEIYQYPTGEREPETSELVFSHEGTVGVVCSAFAKTFAQLYADRDTDEFEFNWRHPFPVDAYRNFEAAVGRPR